MIGELFVFLPEGEQLQGDECVCEQKYKISHCMADKILKIVVYSILATSHRKYITISRLSLSL